MILICGLHISVPCVPSCAYHFAQSFLFGFLLLLNAQCTSTPCIFVAVSNSSCARAGELCVGPKPPSVALASPFGSNIHTCVIKNTPTYGVFMDPQFMRQMGNKKAKDKYMWRAPRPVLETEAYAICLLL